MKKASKRRILFAARMATMVGAACFAVSGISETLGQEKEKSRPVYIATEEVAETTYTPEVEEATQPTETAKAVETEEPLIAKILPKHTVRRLRRRTVLRTTHIRQLRISKWLTCSKTVS